MRIAWVCGLLVACGGSDDTASTSTTDAPVDTGAIDSATDTRRIDTATGDGFIPCNSPRPEPLTPKAPYKPPSGRYQGKCTVIEIDNASTLAPMAFATKVSAGCATCLATPSATATAYGPVVVLPDNSYLLNSVAGCAAFAAGDMTTTGVASAAWIFRECLGAVCFECATEDRPSCYAEATTGACAADYAKSIALIEANPAWKAEYEKCNAKLSPVRSVFSYFCGSDPSGDAGTDAASD
jgi:hypothetical protein